MQKITSLTHDGRGITIIDGKKSFISGALPDETVACQITKKHSRYNEGIATEIISASSSRTEPLCKHFGICGGCSLQHMEMSAELAFKQKILLEQLKFMGHVEPEKIMPPLSGHSFGYRRKARLGVRYVRKKGKLLVGFREKFTNYLADIEECPILQENVGKHIKSLAELIRSLTQYEHIAQIEVAAGDKETALVFRHLTDLPECDRAKLIEFGKQYSFHIYLQPNKPQSLSKLYPENHIHRLDYALPDYHLNLQFHPLDFIQINGEMNLLMIQEALTLLDLNSNDTVLDLFCGLGNFTLPIAQRCQKVIGLEGSIDMVERAKENALANQIQNAEFYAINLMENLILPSHTPSQYDKILLDPPRTGAKEIIAHFPSFSPKKIVYISCNPATLARDAGELVNHHGYHLKQVRMINMFPHTAHIEAIALFES